MMKILSLSILVSMVLLTYQNCSPSHTGGMQTFKLASLYPYYEAKPRFFESVQLTEAVQDNSGLWTYQFVVSVAFADDPSEQVDVEVNISDQNDAILCPRTLVTVSRADNHLVIDDCQSNAHATAAKITLKAKLTTETVLEPVRSYTFDLSKTAL